MLPRSLRTCTTLSRRLSPSASTWSATARTRTASTTWFLLNPVSTVLPATTRPLVSSLPTGSTSLPPLPLWSPKVFWSNKSWRHLEMFCWLQAFLSTRYEMFAYTMTWVRLLCILVYRWVCLFPNDEAIQIHPMPKFDVDLDIHAVWRKRFTLNGAIIWGISLGVSGEWLIQGCAVFIWCREIKGSIFCLCNIQMQVCC